MITQVYTDALVSTLERKLKNKYLFTDVFGDMQVIKNSSSNKLFTVKVFNKHTQFKNYIKDKNVAFGSGTANSSRFGQREEVIYSDITVPITFDKAVDHGFDKTTVNTDIDAAIKDVTATTWDDFTHLANTHLSEGIIKSAKDTPKTISDIIEIFEQADALYTNSRFNDQGVVYVSAPAYAEILKHPKITTLKHSSVNIDSGAITEVFGFKALKVSKEFLGGCDVVFAPKNMGIYAVDIKTARLIEHPDFDGYAYQIHIRGGYFLPQTDSFKELIILGKLKAQTPPNPKPTKA